MNKKGYISTVTASSIPIITKNSTIDPKTILKTKNIVPTVLTKPTKLLTRSSKRIPSKPKHLIATGAVSISSSDLFFVKIKLSQLQSQYQQSLTMTAAIQQYEAFIQKQHSLNLPPHKFGLLIVWSIPTQEPL